MQQKALTQMESNQLITITCRAEINGQPADNGEVANDGKSRAGTSFYISIRCFHTKNLFSGGLKNRASGLCHFRGEFPDHVKCHLACSFFIENAVVIQLIPFGQRIFSIRYSYKKSSYRGMVFIRAVA